MDYPTPLSYGHDFPTRKARPTTPIEIPNRGNKRTSLSPCFPSTAHELSPDLLFEMSPLTTEYPSIYDIVNSTARDDEPLLYSFPRVSTHIPMHKNRCQSPRSPIQAARGPDFEPKLMVWPKLPPYTTPNYQHAPLSSCDNLDNRPNKGNPVHKIIGFTPLCSTENESSISRPSTPKGRLSPPPRHSSYTSSPWIFPGSSDTDEEFAHDPSPSTLEFDKYLIRRIERRRAVPHRDHLFSSMQA